MINRSKNKKTSLIIFMIIVSLIFLLSGCNSSISSNPSVSEQSIDAPVPGNNEKEISPIIDKLLSGEVFCGQASDDPSGKSWDFSLSISTYDASSGNIVGQIEWPELNAIHRIEGNIDANTLVFTETDYIKKGSAYLGAKYTLIPEGEQITGIWIDKDNHQQGSVSFKIDRSISSKSSFNTVNSLEDSKKQDHDSFKYEYGYSGYNEPLIVYKISNNPSEKKNLRKILCVFEIHGFEDAFYKDGQVLVDIANDLVDYFINNREELKNYELLVVPSANPDGLKQGWTCNGPGRCQVSQGIDINMDFDYSFKVRTNKRNKTGDQAFTSPEAQALKELVIAENPDIIIDFHGWINIASGDKEIADLFCKNLGLIYEPTEKAIYRGFFSDGLQNMLNQY